MLHNANPPGSLNLSIFLVFAQDHNQREITSSWFWRTLKYPNTKPWTGVPLKLCWCCRQWPNIKSAVGQRLMFTGIGCTQSMCPFCNTTARVNCGRMYAYMYAYAVKQHCHQTLSQHSLLLSDICSTCCCRRIPSSVVLVSAFCLLITIVVVVECRGSMSSFFCRHICTYFFCRHNIADAAEKSTKSGILCLTFK